jgi:hypothetical protein
VLVADPGMTRRDIIWPMHYLDAHAGSLQVLASVILVLVTAVYTVLTRTLAKAAREAMRPYVYLDVSFASQAEMIVLVGNSGTRVAGNVRAKIARCNNEVLQKAIGGLPLTSGIGHLVPGSTRKYSVIVRGKDLFTENGPSPVISFEFTYHDGKRVVTDTQEINLGGYRESLFPWYGDPTYQIVRELQNIVSKMPEKRVAAFFPSPKKACSYCGTLIAESAKKCPACLEWVSVARKRHWKTRIPYRA